MDVDREWPFVTEMAFEGAMFQDELALLADGIEASMSQTGFKVVFQSSEPHLEFEARSPMLRGKVGVPREERRETVEVAGYLDHSPALGTGLRFSLESDRGRLGETARQIRALLARFPERGGQRRSEEA